MSEFEYFSAVIAVILALGVTHILGQIDVIVRRPGAVRLHWIPTVWVVVVLLSHFFAWWNIWQLKGSLRYSFPVFLYMLVGPTALFLAARLVLPLLTDEGSINLEQHYFSVRRPFFVMMSVFVVWPAILTMALPGPAAYRGILEHLALLVPIAACALTANRIVHRVVTVVIGLTVTGALFGGLG